MSPRTYMIKHEDGSLAGPITGGRLMAMASDGSLTPGTLVMVVGTDRWVAAGSIPQLDFRAAATRSDSPPAAEEGATIPPAGEAMKVQESGLRAFAKPLAATKFFDKTNEQDFWRFSRMITPDVIRLLFIISTVLLGLSLVLIPVLAIKDLGELSLDRGAALAARERGIDAAEEKLRSVERELSQHMEEERKHRGKPNYTQAHKEALDKIKELENELERQAAKLGQQGTLDSNMIETLKRDVLLEQRALSSIRFSIIASHTAMWLAIPLLWGLTRVAFESLIIIFRIYERLGEIQSHEGNR